MFSERTQLRLRDIADNIEAVNQYAEGLSRAQFENDRRTSDAIERCLQRITEAVIQIDVDDMARIAPDIPFEKVRGLGNMLRHEYHRIDPGQIFATVHDELPALRAAIMQALEDR